MNEAYFSTLGKILAFAAVVEVGTGLLLMIDPALMAAVLIGAEVTGTAAALARLFGIALLALGPACWPRRQRAEDGSPAALRGMLIYNVLVALDLTYLGAIGPWHGALLWPAVALHAIVALALVWTWRAHNGVG
jgi:hypothetical protein